MRQFRADMLSSREHAACLAWPTQRAPAAPPLTPAKSTLPQSHPVSACESKLLNGFHLFRKMAPQHEYKGGEGESVRKSVKRGGGGEQGNELGRRRLRCTVRPEARHWEVGE